MTTFDRHPARRGGSVLGKMKLQNEPEKRNCVELSPLTLALSQTLLTLKMMLRITSAAELLLHAAGMGVTGKDSLLTAACQRLPDKERFRNSLQQELQFCTLA
jgi:hypothetical protein